MTLELFTECPAWEQARFDDNGHGMQPHDEYHARWSRLDGQAPPRVGDLIRVGRWGEAVVTGYFVEGGWLGVRSTLLNPPKEWFNGRKPGSEHDCCTFGPEFELVAWTQPEATDANAVAITWRSHNDGPAFRIYGMPPKAAAKVAKIVKAGGFEYDGRNACQVADKYTHGHANAFALAARLRAAGFAVTHAGCYGEDGPPSAGAVKWWH